MNAAPQPLRRFLFGLLLLASFALAQEEDQILQNYSLGIENLAQAVELMPNDSLQSTDALERASTALRFLAGSSNSTTLVSQLQNTFERAKTSIQNQSQDDLAVQVAVLKGGFQRLVYEAAIGSANNGDLATTQARLTRIARNSGLPEEVQTALSNEADLGKLFATFEQGSANIIKAHLGNVSGWLEQDKGVAYQTLASAYGTYLPIADSPRVDASSGSLFSQSFQALVADDTETLNQGISQLNTQMDTLANAAAAIVSGTTSATVPVVEAAPVTEAEAVVAETPEVAVANVEVAQPEAVQGEAVDAAAPEAVVAEASEIPAVDATTTEPTTTEPTTTEPTTTDPAVDPAVDPNAAMAAPVTNPFKDALTGELARMGLSPNQQDNISEKLLADGYTSVNSVVNDVMAKTGFAMSAVQEGDQGKAKKLLQGVQGTYSTFLSDIVNGKDPAVDTGTQGLLATLSSSPSLRQEDVATLNQQWASVSNALGNTEVTPSGLQGVANGVTGFWAGWTRTIVMIVLGLFAFVPLYLLFLAFGGGNRNWQLIGYALFLLLLPIIYEGVSFLLSAINSFVNVPTLDILSRFSFFQNPVMQVVWAVLTAAAIALATMGLYGICVQFGLIGRKDDVAGTIVESSAPSQTSIESARTTNFEWDEEF
jgi:hypothetical protein